MMLDIINELISDIITLDDETLRELVNGMWFVLSVEILCALLFYIVSRYRAARDDPHWEWSIPVPWWQELGTQLAISWSCYIFGSAVRSGWVYVFLECTNRLTRDGCQHVVDRADVLYVASFFAIAGAVCTIRVMLPQRWNPWSYVVPGLIAVCLPVAAHILVRLF